MTKQLTITVTITDKNISTNIDPQGDFSPIELLGIIEMVKDNVHGNYFRKINNQAKPEQEWGRRDYSQPKRKKKSSKTT